MSGLIDYMVDRDHFVLSINEWTLALAFPCCCCGHKDKTDTEYPCSHCDHNINSVR